jgi:hypothetical protein
LPSDTQPVNSPTAQNKTAYLIVSSDISQAALSRCSSAWSAALAHRLGAGLPRRHPIKRSYFLPVALKEVSDLEVARA